jgi:tetratricopeptide (TPR) repeat protein
LEDYDKAIELYPDFAKAYMNRSYVHGLLGNNKASKRDYETAQKKVKEYREKSSSDVKSFADTTKKYSSLLALDAEFAKKDFNDELLQHRDIDIKLRPLYKFVLSGVKDQTTYALSRGYENPLLQRFEQAFDVGVQVRNSDMALSPEMMHVIEQEAWSASAPSSTECFLRAMYDYAGRKFNSALDYYGKAIDAVEEQDKVSSLYESFYYMNRGVLRAEMIEFIASIQSNVQVLSMDDSGNTRARVKDQVVRQYDYADAVSDMKKAAEILPDIPYIYYNLGNLYCLSAEHISSIDNYTKAIELYPYMGDAYFNRGLVLIYLKDKEKGCIDLSRAGELGVQDAYGVIKRYCEDEK